MKWVYEIEWMDGRTENIPSVRHLTAPENHPHLLTIYVNPHGHEGRFDTITIPLVNVRRYAITEVQ